MTIADNAAGRTHVGRVRHRNEDALYVGRNLFVVADGMGGHVAGDIASTAAIEAVKVADTKMPDNDLADALARAVFAADDAIRRRRRADPAVDGMGTTMVALLLGSDTA